MKPTMEILARINQDSRRNKEEIFTRLYRYLLRPDIYYVAYQNLYANKGAGTKGTDKGNFVFFIDFPDAIWYTILVFNIRLSRTCANK